jgi:putative acetyltransferase
MSIIIRTETNNDYDQVRDVNFQAFGNKEDEANLVDRIRKTEYFIPQLSIVAEQSREIIGHLLMSKAEVINEEIMQEVIVLAPIAVKPNHQNNGIGKELITEGLKRCTELGFYIVMLIGHPTYYPKFGFKQARAFGLELKQFDVPDEVFMVCELKENELINIKGELKYPRHFLSKGQI